MAFDFNKLKTLETRRPDGHNNDGDANDANDQGAADTTFVRITDNSYADGIGALPPQAPNGQTAGAGTLPAPDVVSAQIMAAGTIDILNSFNVNEYFQFFGQVLTHDMAESSTGNSGDPAIPLPMGGTTFQFTRTPYQDGTGTEERQQINTETSFLDLSVIYGNSQEVLDLFRAGTGASQSAKLLMGAENLLPTILEVANNAGITPNDVLVAWRPEGFAFLPDPADFTDPITYQDVYFSGDNRVDQTPMLIAQHTIWAREHNYQVDRLTPTAVANGWSQDQLFEAARAITEAEWQHVVYDEYLAKLLGPTALKAYSSYKANVDTSIINEFSAVAFRFGHDQSSQTQLPLDELGNVTNPGNAFVLFSLAECFTSAVVASTTSDNIDAWLRGQLSNQSQQIDGRVVDGNRNTLGFDLEVFDIMRARDHGVWNYNALREGLGLSQYASFDAFAAANNVSAARLNALKLVYGNDISKLDALVGGLLETKVAGGQLGETFTRIVVTQFEALRDGDRLFYDTRFAAFPELRAEIDQTSLADIIARTSGIDHMYRDAFLAFDRITDNDGTIDGSGRNDLAIGTALADTIKTLGGNDDTSGGNGADFIDGGDGDDFVAGDGGKDTLLGGAQADTFIFAEYDAVDRIGDFNKKKDFIGLDATFFTGLDDGVLSSDVFVKGKKAGDLDDRILYDRHSGILYFDSNGSDVGGKHAFAKVDPGTYLSHKNIFVDDFLV